jgi:hypothetical protein
MTDNPRRSKYVWEKPDLVLLKRGNSPLIPKHETASFKKAEDGEVLGWYTEGGRHIPIKAGGNSGKELISKNPTMEDINKLDPSLISYGTKYDPIEGDSILANIYEKQGFNEKPTMVSQESYDKLIANGQPDLYRGVGSNKSVQDFKNGDTHHAGLGVGGNGTYTSEDKEVAVKFAGKNEDGSQNLMQMTLSPDANIVTSSDIIEEMRVNEMSLLTPQVSVYSQVRDMNLPDEEAEKMYNTLLSQKRESKDKIQALYSDVGRYAALRNFDAISYPTGAGQKGTNTYIVLNRGKVVMPK